MVTRCLVVMIELMNASLTREGRPVLSPMNMQLAAGQHLAVLGPNGAGKSSLLRLLSGDSCVQPAVGCLCLEITQPRCL
jgi:ABC-type molybdenum transport system ATPase subunit/photorepair protein PhrA